jgi:hypothetical protein
MSVSTSPVQSWARRTAAGHDTTSHPPAEPHGAPVRERGPSVPPDRQGKYGFGGLSEFRRATLVVCRGLSVKCNCMKIKGKVVALTGIEPATLQFSSVQLGLSSCVFGLVQSATRAFMAVRRADVLPWCCPAAGIRLIAGQSDTVGRLASIFLANVIHFFGVPGGPTVPGGGKTRCRQPIFAPEDSSDARRRPVHSTG